MNGEYLGKDTKNKQSNLAAETINAEKKVSHAGKEEKQKKYRNLSVALMVVIVISVVLLVVLRSGSTRSHVHVWVEADCENGKRCAECDAVDGDPLGHEMTKTNYQDPSTCSRCGITQGRTLYPDMERYGITEFMEEGVVYSYSTSTEHREEKRTTGELQILSYEVFTSASGYPVKEGYKWHVVQIQADFFDSNARSWGASVGCCHENYYNIDLFDSTYTHDKESGLSSRMVNYHGEDVPVYYKETGTWSGWKVVDGRKQNSYSLTRAWLIPEGYDGAVIGFYNEYSVEWGKQHIYEIYTPEDFLLFRLDR